MENNNNKKNLTRTFGIQYYGEGINGSRESLNVEYFENNIKIGIHPEIPSTGRYDYKVGNEIFLREKNVKTLSRLLEKAIKASEAGESFKPIGVPSASNFIQITPGSKVGCPNCSIALEICNDIDPNTMKCQSRAVFGFRNSDMIGDYDFTTGTYEKYAVNSDVVYFLEQLKEASKALTNAYAHVHRKENRFDMDRLISNQLTILNQLGVNPTTSMSSKNSWNNSNKAFNGGGQGQTLSLDEASDILDEIDNLT